MLYPYNAIFGRGIINTFKAALHSGYLCLKILATFGVISIFYSQKDVSNIEQGCAPGHKNVHFLQEQTEQYQHSTCPLKAESPAEYKKAIEADGELKNVSLDPRVPDRAVCIGTETGPKE
jgi:hypothetical protein